MKRATSLVAVVLCLLVGVSSAWAYTGRDLDRADRMRDRGDFFEARRLYSAIASDYYTSDYLRRQGGYFVGFCSVRLSEPYNAIEDFRRFLRTFDNGNTTLIPDALYVLGRTYEDVGNRERARKCYRDCINRFGYGEFPQKCQERLRYLDDYYHGPYGPSYSVEEAPAAVRAAKNSGKSLSASDPFEGFTMDLQSEKTAQLKDKFEQLHAKP